MSPKQPSTPKHNYTLLGAALLLLVMGVLMLIAAGNDSATADETTFLSTGYTYLTGHRYHFAPEHPSCERRSKSAGNEARQERRVSMAIGPVRDETATRRKHSGYLAK